MEYEIIMGLEVHVELSTKTKIFCGCSTAFGGEPNAHTCPVCLGMPGSLPVLNEGVVDCALRAGLALGCEIGETNVFDRKNYFYPDLPKDYQISQLYKPICVNGRVELDLGDRVRTVRIHEIHMEEDAGKLVHDAGGSLVDYNRCGVPLIEIVSEPDLRDADEVIAYLERLREILTYADVSDCKLQEGSMRVDVNLSVRPAGTEGYGTRTETKNLNSFRSVRRTIEYESKRQIALLESGGRVTQETRRWDDEKGENYAMRSKENAQDYRYFPDPDLIPVRVSAARRQAALEALPELADAKRRRYVSELGIEARLAGVLTASRRLAALFERVAEASGLPAAAANLVAGDILRLVKEDGIDLDELSADGEKLGAILRMTAEGRINRAVAGRVTEAVFRDGVDPAAFVREQGLTVIDDASRVDEAARRVIDENPGPVSDFRAGKEKAFGFLVGRAMKLLDGRADPKRVNERLRERLGGAPPAGETGANGAREDAGAGENAGAARADGEKRAAMRERVTPPAGGARIASGARDTAGGETRGAIETSGRYRTKNCGELTPDDVGATVRLAGWIHAIRNHGGVAFADLRDAYGVTQIVLTDAQLAGLNRECVVSATGRVLLRDAETVNPNIATGLVELRADETETLGKCLPSLPFETDASTETREELRLKYRFLDLRNPKLRDNILIRSEIIRFLRAEMGALGFPEIQTPILANSSPEGARDYLVPSRKHKGKFYALPQAPQQFKQLLMVSGFDRYFQIAPCFRDEDARLDRSPGEFYQLDFEMAFATQEDVFAVAERVLTNTFRRFSDKPVSAAPFTRIPFAEAMLKYGTDKPDLRNPLVIIDLADFFANVDFAPFRGKPVRGIVAPDAAGRPKSFFKSMEAYALSVGMKGLGYISVKDDMGYKGPIDKFLTDDRRQEIAALAALKPGDVLYFISDAPGAVARYAGLIRTELGTRLDLTDRGRYEFCFITDFPMYEINEETGKTDFTHNPFSMPQGEMEALLTKDPLEIKAWQYDIVCNGTELSSGAVRNHRPDVMVKAFEIAGYSEKDVREKFGALYNAFHYGAPPHAGMAPGVDRIVMLLTGEENIREVIAFPLDSNARNLLLDAPGEVTEAQLRDVHIKIR